MVERAQSGTLVARMHLAAIIVRPFSPAAPVRNLLIRYDRLLDRRKFGPRRLKTGVLLLSAFPTFLDPLRHRRAVRSVR